jgi:hypothetical protein
MTVAPQAGDKIDALARQCANRWYVTEFATALRERRLPLKRYSNFIITLYPLVVGFNGGFIRSIAKLDELQKSVQAGELMEEILTIDHVRNSSRIQILAVELRTIAREDRLPRLRALARQLNEEQEHNDYWRKMLEAHGIDHEAYYTAFETYLHETPSRELDRMTQEVLTALMEGHTPDAFHNTSFSQPVLALCHYLTRTSADPAVRFFIYHALQSAIEFTLVKTVSESIFPGVAGTRDHPQLHPELVPDAHITEEGAVPLSIKWWDEHTVYGQGGRTELNHVKHGREQLNRELREEVDIKEALCRVNEVLRLFFAAAVA